MIYLYAVVDDPGVRLTGLSGHGGAPLVCVPAGRLAAVASEHDDLRLPEGAAGLWTHNCVVDGLMERCTVAPARFGTTLPDAGVLGEVLRRQEKELHAALLRVHGKVELAVRGSVDPDRLAPAIGQSPSLPPGRGYLAHLRRQDASPALRGVHACLSSRAAGATARFDGSSAVSAAYLVERDEVEAFTAGVSQLAATLDGVSLSLTGPWAPFSFVAGEVLTVG